MSSHRISASGDRPFSLSAGGGQQTGLSVPSKRTDAFTFNATGFAKIELGLFGDVHIDQYRVTNRAYKEGEEPTVSTILVLRVGDGESAQHGLQIYGEPVEDAEEQVGGENTSLDLRRRPERFGPTVFYEKAELVSSINVADLAQPDAE